MKMTTVFFIFTLGFVCAGEPDAPDSPREIIVFSALVEDYWQSMGGISHWSHKDKSETALMPMPGFIMDPRVSHDEKRLVFARFQSEPKDNTDIYIFTFDDKSLIRITDEAVLEYAPAWSPDDQRIAFVSGRGARSHYLSIVNRDGSARKVLQPNRSDDMSPRWSPDGHWIVFASSQSHDYEIWRVRPDGVDLQKLTNTPGLDSNPCYSPDGKRIVFNSNRDGLLGLWVMDADGMNPTRLTPAAMTAREPHWLTLNRVKP
jgi:Tol biopolymer transport system component